MKENARFAMWLLSIAALSAAALAQPLTFSLDVVDVSALNSSLFLALRNGTVVSLEGGLRWDFDTLHYGLPVHLEAAPPHGLLVLTDRAWLGLLAFDGRSSWLKLALDPNSIKPGVSGVIYASGVALIYAGAYAVLVSVPTMHVVWSHSVVNRFTDYSLSPSGDALLLAGFNTLCYICVLNDEKYIVIRDTEKGEDLFSASISHLKSASVLWRNSWLVLVLWDAVKVYDLAALAAKGLSSPLKTFTPPHPHEGWLSYGFSPSGGLFHYTRADEGRLGVYVLDIERGLSKYIVLPIPAGRRVLSRLDDDWKLAVASYDPVAGTAYCALLDALTGELRAEKISPAEPSLRLKLLSGRAAAVVGGKLVTLPGQQRVEGLGSRRAATCFVTVKAVGDDGTPLPGALVCANSTCATTALDGVATLELAQGFYVLEASHPLAEPYRGSLLVSSNFTVPLIMTRLFTLTVKGVLESGRQPSLCSIALAKNLSQAQSVVAPNCTASFRVPRGPYVVVLQFGSQRIKQSVEVASDTILLVGLKEDLAKLSVEAINASGAPVANATIVVLGDDGETIALLTGKGAVAVRPGRYVIRVRAAGYTNWSAIAEVVGDARLSAVLEQEPVPRGARSLRPLELVAIVALSGAAGALAGVLSASLGRCLAAHLQKPAMLKRLRVVLDIFRLRRGGRASSAPRVQPQRGARQR